VGTSANESVMERVFLYSAVDLDSRINIKQRLMIKQSRSKREQNEGFLAKRQMKAGTQTYFLLLLHKCFLPFSQAQDGRHFFLLFLNFVLFPFFTGSQLNKRERLEIRMKKHENVQLQIPVHHRIN